MREKRITIESDYEKALRELDENIVTVVKNNPGISTYEVLQRQEARLKKCSGMAKEAIRQAFTRALANNLGETIQCLGKKKKVDGQYWEQLTIFKA